ncbi:hypothetical protein GW17_00011058, partial [Ensete ventricosum]
WVTSACSSIVATFSHSYGNSDLVGDRATKGRGGSGVHRLFFPYRGLLERVEVVFFMLHTTIKPTCPVSTAFTLKDDTTPQVAVATKLERMKGKKEGKIERDEHDRLGVEAGDNSETAQGRECCHVYAAPAGEIMRPRRRRRRRTGSGRLAHVRAPLPTANRGCSPPPSSPFVLPSPYISALPCHTSPATTTALDDEQCDGTGGDAVYHGGGGGELSVPASLPAAAQWRGLCCRHPEEVPLPSRFQRRLGEGLAGLNESFLSYSCQGDRRSGRSSCLRSFGFDCKCCFVSLTRKFGCFGC